MITEFGIDQWPEETPEWVKQDANDVLDAEERVTRAFLAKHAGLTPARFARLCCEGLGDARLVPRQLTGRVPSRLSLGDAIRMTALWFLYNRSRLLVRTPLLKRSVWEAMSNTVLAAGLVYAWRRAETEDPETGERTGPGVYLLIEESEADVHVTVRAVLADDVSLGAKSASVHVVAVGGVAHGIVQLWRAEQKAATEESTTSEAVDA